MRTAAVAFSECGAAIAEKLGAELFLHKRDFDSVYELTARIWHEYDALVFISACGIAVRAIAAHVRSKLSDPAVVVCDETGRFAVSLLSGHVGGANDLTEKIAGVTGAQAVITTASDNHDVPRERNLVLGIGCRRGLAAETIERAVTIMLWKAKIPLFRVCEAATIDIKQNDKGLVEFAKAHELPLYFYSSEELKRVPGEFSASERVLNVTGVDNVCERAAALRGGTGKLVLKKTTKDGVAVALFEKEFESE
jgi:cobalt-precorrin 5A hydrolase